MKILLIILSLLLTTTAYSKTRKIVPETKENVAYLLEFLQPNNSEEQSLQLAESVLKYSKEINIDWRLFVSIMYQESSLLIDPQHCLKKELHPQLVRRKIHNKWKTMALKTKCADYGIAQINFKTWGEELALNKEKLLTDIDYSVKAASKILFYYKHRYAKRDKRWHLRYHSGTISHKNEYEGFIQKRYKKITNALKNIKNNTL